MLSLPHEILKKIASRLSFEDLARSLLVGGSWSRVVCERLHPIRCDLRVVAFDDGEQAHAIRLPFVKLSNGMAVYRQTTLLARKKTLHDPTQSYEYQNPTWICCAGDLRKERIFLDLVSYNELSFGKIKLGKNWDNVRRNVKGRRETQKDGSFLDYHVEYNARDFMSWFRIHEIHLPLKRLRRGVSHDCL